MGNAAKEPQQQDSLPDQALEASKPTGAALVITDVQDTTDVLQVLDRHDEMQIIERLQGKLGEKWFYKFPGPDGKEVCELSVSGVWDTVNEMNQTGKVNISIDKDAGVEWERELLDTDFGADVRHISATVYARDARTGIGAYGTYSQPLVMKLTEQTAAKRRSKKKYAPEDLLITDPFARQKALNKAERNALRKLVPQKIAQTLIAQYLGDPAKIKVINAGAGAEALAELPPPLTDEKAEAQKARARELYDEIRDINALILVPAVFHTYLRDAEHSHERLDDFLGFLGDLLERNQKGDK